VGRRVGRGLRRRPSTADVAAALPGWLTARAIVLGTLGLAHFLVDRLHPRSAAVAFKVHQGLFAWDGAWYRAIAAHGYGPLPRNILRFFPLYPLSGRALGLLLAGRRDVALVVIANVGALAVGALLHRLTLRETGDARLARRAAWLVALAPPAFVLVLAYSEALAMTLALWAFLSLRSRRWGQATAAGVLLGLTRPLGLLLVVPAAIEAGRGFWSVTMRERLARGLATAAPAVGTGAYLAWAQLAYGSWRLPIRGQQDPHLRGHFVDPITALRYEGRGLLHGTHLGSGLHVPWALLLLVLALVALRKFPLSYAGYAGVTLLASLSSTNLDSLERYALSAFPFVMAAAAVTASERVERAVLVLSSAGLAAYALLAFLNVITP
jgi:hypothetical protein